MRPVLSLIPKEFRQRMSLIYHGLPSIRQAKNEIRDTQNFADWYDVVKKIPYIHSEQKKTEIVGLLERVHALAPQYICEIGTSKGGTLFLLSQISQPNATVISIDIGNTFDKRLVYKASRKESQDIFVLKANSQIKETRAKVQNLLKGHQLDFLFIDGDHSYSGVKADFELYAPLVRSGGLIALHDIVPDHREDKSVHTKGRPNSGEVPQFWQEIRQQYQSEEIIEEQTQDGYGIGLLYWQDYLEKAIPNQ